MKTMGWLQCNVEAEMGKASSCSHMRPNHSLFFSQGPSCPSLLNLLPHLLLRLTWVSSLVERLGLRGVVVREAWCRVQEINVTRPVEMGRVPPVRSSNKERQGSGVKTISTTNVRPKQRGWLLFVEGVGKELKPWLFVLLFLLLFSLFVLVLVVVVVVCCCSRCLFLFLLFVVV